MRFSSFIYLVGQGLHNLRANRLMTFASMGVLTVCMLLIGAASLLGINIDHMVEYIGNQNETVVYMGGTGESEVATDEQIAAADAAIRNTPQPIFMPLGCAPGSDGRPTTAMIPDGSKIL